MVKLKRNSIFLVAVCTIAMVFSVSFLRSFDNKEVSDFQSFVEHKITEEGKDDLTIVEKIIVDVKGAVTNPGVYELIQGERVFHAIEKAGGFVEDANKNVINLALLLEDEMVIYVPSNVEEELGVQPMISSFSQSDGKININKATSEELQKIPGIGPAKAAAIISYREEFGKFKNIDELTRVSGIGKKTVEKIAEFIVVK